MKAKAGATTKPLANFESLSPYLRKLLLQARNGSEPAREELRDYIKQTDRQDSLEGRTAIAQVLIHRLGVDTIEEDLKASMEILVLVSGSTDDDIDDVLLEESPVILDAIKRYLQLTLLPDYGTQDVERAWHTFLPPSLCISRAVACVLRLGSRPQDLDPSRFPSVDLFIEAPGITLQLWFFYSRTFHLMENAHLGTFSILGKTLFDLLYWIEAAPEVENDMYAKLTPHLHAEDVISLCIAHLERYHRTRDKEMAARTTLGVLTILRIMHDRIPEQQRKIHENGHLVPALAAILKRTLLAFPRSHCEIDRVHTSVAAHICALLRDVMLEGPLRAIRVPQALNCGIWSACCRLALIGACDCNPHGNKRSYNSVSERSCPWTRILEELDRDRHSLIPFPIDFSRYLVDTLLRGRAATYRQLEKAMRRSAYEEAERPGDLKRQARTPEWERNLQLMCCLLEKRRQYGEYPREKLCDRLGCRTVVYPKDLQVCSGCLSCHFCSRECQKVDWEAYHCRNCSLPDNCKYPLEKTGVDYDFLDWLYEDSPEFEEAGFGLITSDSDSDMDPDEDADNSNDVNQRHAEVGAQ